MRTDRAGGEYFADLHERAFLVTHVMECSVVLEFLLLEAFEILVGPDGILARFAVVAADSGGLLSVVANGGGALLANHLAFLVDVGRVAPGEHGRTGELRVLHDVVVEHAIGVDAVSRADAWTVEPPLIAAE